MIRYGTNEPLYYSGVAAMILRCILLGRLLYCSFCLVELSYVLYLICKLVTPTPL